MEWGCQISWDAKYSVTPDALISGHLLSPKRKKLWSSFLHHKIAHCMTSLVPRPSEGGGNTLFAHALNLLLGNCIMDASDVDVWAGFC